MELSYRRGDVRFDVFEGELGCMRADDDEPVTAVTLVPGFDVGQLTLAVDAGLDPEIDENDLTPQIGE